MTVEVELKLKLPETAKADFLRLGPLNQTGSSPCTQRLINIYFDTPDLALTQQKMALRLRKKGDQWLQTIKHGGTSGAGLHQRPELEVPVPGAEIDLTRIADPELSEFLRRPDIGPCLRPVFSTNFDRTTWNIKGPNGSLIELALDEGTIESNGRQAPLLEVELELKEGEVGDLFQVAFELAGSVPLLPDAQSKAQRGYALYRNAPLIPIHATIPKLDKKMTPYQALQTVMYETLRQLQGNVQGLLSCDDPEFIHQARIAFRRLRTLEKVFGPLLADDEWQEITDSAKALAGILGQARDWHILLAETLPSIASVLPDKTCIEMMESRIQKHQQEAADTARQAMQSIRYGQLLLRLLSLANLQAAFPEITHQSLCDFSAAALQRRYKAWHRLAKRWESLDATGRHELRKKTKKLRYAAEFFTTLYKPQHVEEYVHSLQQLQDVLGETNDAVTGQRLLDLLANETPALGYCAGYAAGWLAKKQAELELGLGRQVKHQQHEKTFW